MTKTKRDALVFTIGQLIVLVAACAIVFSVLRLTDELALALWALASVLKLSSVPRDWESIRNSGLLPNLASIAFSVVALVLAVLSAYGVRLYFEHQQESSFFSGLGLLVNDKDHFVFLVILSLLAVSPVPIDLGLKKSWLYAKTALNVCIGILAAAMLLLFSVDLACVASLTDLGIESIRQAIVDSSVPGVTVDPYSIPRTTSETVGYILVTLGASSAALVGVVVMVAWKPPKRRLGVLLMVPGALWLATISVGPGYRLSPFLFGAIAEGLDPLAAVLCLCACAIAALRLSTMPKDQSYSASDSGPFLEFAICAAGFCTLYERGNVEAIVNGEFDLSVFFVVPSTMYVELAVLVFCLTSMRNLVARLLGFGVQIPDFGHNRDVAILFFQLLFLGPLCVLSGAVYWMIYFG